MIMFVPLQVIMTLPHGSGPQEKVGKQVLEVETSKQRRKILGFISRTFWIPCGTFSSFC